MSPQKKTRTMTFAHSHDYLFSVVTTIDDFQNILKMCLSFSTNGAVYYSAFVSFFFACTSIRITYPRHCGFYSILRKTQFTTRTV